jgi:hypothetical protein
MPISLTPCAFRIMNKLAQAGILSIVLGGVLLLLGLFPFAADFDNSPGVGISQLTAIIGGLFFLVLGGYVVLYAVERVNRPHTLLRDVGVRLGMTGLVVSAASALADTLGFGSHSAAALLGWVQASGILVGFGLSAIGVFIYGLALRRESPPTNHRQGGRTDGQRRS